MKEKTFHIVSLGCAKNTVDSDSMAQLLVNSGYEQIDDSYHAGILIVNTCGFIAPAKEESLNALAELSNNKNGNQVLIATGCLTQRYGTDITKIVSGIDGILGTRRWMDIVNVVESLGTNGRHELRHHIPEAASVGKDEHGALRVSVQGASAYLKIADGCRRPCAFCAIPLIKGTAVSRPVESILTEARYLQSAGIREIILIAQDTTDYGHDLGLRNGLSYLLKQISTVAPDVDWIRVMYTFPGKNVEKLIDVMADNKQVVSYLDIPLQHAHPSVLRRMKRPANMDWVRKTLDYSRKTIPDMALRTTFIVGYPGETEEEFQTLLGFIEEIRFDRLGAFKFSFEQGTGSETLGDPIPEEVKEERLARLMEKQQQISLEKNRTFIGKQMDVLIEGTKQGLSIGRSSRDAPEVDGLVLVKGKIPSGKMVSVKITDAMVYDLSGEVLT